MDGAKPRLLSRVPKEEKHPRVWHFLKIFPMKSFEYCTQVSINEKYRNGKVRDFNGIAFFAALFASRRLHLTLLEGYSREKRFLNQTDSGKAFGKLPADDFIS